MHHLRFYIYHNSQYKYSNLNLRIVPHHSLYTTLLMVHYKSNNFHDISHRSSFLGLKNKIMGISNDTQYYPKNKYYPYTKDISNYFNQNTQRNSCGSLDKIISFHQGTSLLDTHLYILKLGPYYQLLFFIHYNSNINSVQGLYKFYTQNGITNIIKSTHPHNTHHYNIFYRWLLPRKTLIYIKYKILDHMVSNTLYTQRHNILFYYNFWSN